MSDNKIVPSHDVVRHLKEIVRTPEHVKRKESALFRESKRRLREDGHYECYVCGSTDELQVHHYGGEWSLENVLDLGKLKAFLEEWDVYGYGKLLRNKPLKSVDDVRNMMVLCQEHHTGGTDDGSANGIHNITFPAWISQKLVRDGEETVPLEGDKQTGGDTNGR
jgi:hypothetical protein